MSLWGILDPSYVSGELKNANRWKKAEQSTSFLFSLWPLNSGHYSCLFYFKSEGKFGALEKWRAENWSLRQGEDKQLLVTPSFHPALQHHVLYCDTSSTISFFCWWWIAGDWVEAVFHLWFESSIGHQLLFFARLSFAAFDCQNWCIKQKISCCFML